MMADKAVSTEDLCAEDHKRNVAISLARLEAVLQALVENKVETFKKENCNKTRARTNPKSILKRLRLRSTSSQSTTKNDDENDQEKNEQGNGTESSRVPEHIVQVENVVRKSALKKQSSLSSAGSHQYQSRMPSFEVSSIKSDESRNRTMQYDNIYVDICPSVSERPLSCYCSQDIDGQTMHFDDDYISLKMNSFQDNVETDTIMSEDAIRRARRKRRKRRKRKLKRRMQMAQHEYLVESGVINEKFKSIDVEDSTKKAKWTIVATAGLLLFMCLLLVGITLRMAPIIDEIIRKENEEFLRSLSSHRNASSGSSVHLNKT